MGDAEFWNDQDSARLVINKYKLLKAQTEELTGVLSTLDDAQVGFELSQEESDKELLVEVDQQLFDLENRMHRVELQSLLSGKHDHRNCFLSILLDTCSFQYFLL